MAKRQKAKQKSPKVAKGPMGTSGLPGVVGRSALLRAGFTQVVILLVAFAICVSRRPDAFWNPQFWAEDGTHWYAEAYNFGLRCLLMQYAGYLHVFTRLVALFSLLLPLSLAPLVMNLCAMIFEILPVNVLLSSRFFHIGIRTRVLASFIYLALPNTYEIHANLTNVQWHLALLACMLLLAEPTTQWGWRLFTGIVLVMISLDAPMVFVLVPLAAGLWWERRNRGDAVNLVLLLPGAVTQALIVLLTWHVRQGAPNGASVRRLVVIVARQVFLSALVGQNTVVAFGRPDHVYVSVAEIIAAASGLAFLLYVLHRGPMKLRLFILFSFAVFALCLARPIAGSPDRPQWAQLCTPGVGGRYYFLPMLAFLASLVWIATNKAGPAALRYSAASLLVLLPIGMYQDWRHPPFQDYHFRDYAAQFERAPSGSKVSIPINPDWTMELTKH